MQNNFLLPQINLRKFDFLEDSLGTFQEKVAPQNLLIVNQFYPPDFAATGQLIAELAIQLSQLGIDVNVFTGQPGYAFQQESAPCKEVKDGVHVRRTRASMLWPNRIRGKALNGLFFCLRTVLRLLRSVNRTEVLMLTTAPPYLPILGYFAKLLFGQKYICLMYDLYPDVAVGLGVISSEHKLVRFWNWLNCQVWKNAEAIIVLNSTMKDRIVAKCPSIENKISIIHNWADENTIKPLAKQKNPFAHRLNLVNKFTVLYSGNMGRCHDMDTIMQAAIELRHEPIQFVFIGSGAKRQFCMDKVREFSLDNCLFLDYQEKKDLPHSLTACDLSLVSIDRGMEGLVVPSKLYGILAAGRPVAAICEPHSYLRPLLKEANCGAAFNNGEGSQLAQFIRSLAADSNLVQRLGNSGRRYLETQFTPTVIAQQYYATLSRIKTQIRLTQLT